MFMLCQLLVPILVIFGKYCFNLCIRVPLPEKGVKTVPLLPIFWMLSKLQVLEKHFTPTDLHPPAKDMTDPSAAYEFTTLVTKKHLSPQLLLVNSTKSPLGCTLLLHNHPFYTSLICSLSSDSCLFTNSCSGSDRNITISSDALDICFLRPFLPTTRQCSVLLLLTEASKT